MWERALGADSPLPSPHSTNQDPRERSEGFFLWNRLLINAICNETRLVPGVLSIGLVEGGVWGVFAYGGPQTLLVPGASCISPSFTEADACWFFPCHQDTTFLLDGEAEVVGIPAQVTAPRWPRGGIVLESWDLGLSPAWSRAGFEAGPGMAWGQLKSLAELPPSRVFKVGEGHLGWVSDLQPAHCPPSKEEISGI